MVLSGKVLPATVTERPSFTVHRDAALWTDGETGHVVQKTGTVDLRYGHRLPEGHLM